MIFDNAGFMPIMVVVFELGPVPLIVLGQEKIGFSQVDQPVEDAEGTCDASQKPNETNEDDGKLILRAAASHRLVLESVCGFGVRRLAQGKRPPQFPAESPVREENHKTRQQPCTAHDRSEPAVEVALLRGSPPSFRLAGGASSSSEGFG